MNDAAKRFEEILKMLEEQEKQKMDLHLNKDDVLIYGDGGVRLNGLGYVEFSNTGFRQFCSLLRIPVDYARRCLEKDPYLFGSHAKAWWEDVPDNKEFLFRIRRKEGRPFLVRAVLSDRYSTLDYLPVMRETRRVALDSGVNVENWNVEDDFLDIRMTLPGLRRTIGKLGDGKTDDWAMPGIHIRNSETGLSSLRVSLVIVRLVCSNGMTVTKREFEFSRRHIGINDVSRVAETIAATIEKARDGFDWYIERARLAKEKKIDIQKEIERIGGLKQWTRDQMKAVQAAWAEEPGETLHHLVQAVTAAARNQRDWTKRLEMERVASELLNV